MKLTYLAFLIIFSVLNATDALAASCSGGLKKYTVNDPIDLIPFELAAKEYRPFSPEQSKIPVVFIIPTILGDGLIEKRIAEKICSKGMGAYILNVVKGMTPEEEVSDLNSHDNLYVRGLAFVKSMIKELKKDDKINGRFGILGLSQGGMISAYIAGSEPEISASVIVAGAGNVPGVIAYSDQERVAGVREARMSKLSIPDQKSYELFFKDLVPHDPISVAQNVPAGSMYLFIALEDTTVPTRYQLELRDKVRAPLVYEMNSGHVSAIVKAGTIHTNKITSFFRNLLM